MPNLCLSPNFEQNDLNCTYEILTIEDWDRMYLKRLAVFISLSAVLHAVTFASFILIAMLTTGGRGINVQIFDPGSGSASNPVQPMVAGFDFPERIKIFRIDFFKQIIPWTPPPPEPVVVEPEIATVEEETPEEPVVEEPKDDEEIPEEETIDLSANPGEAVVALVESISESGAMREFTSVFEIPEPLVAQPDFTGLDENMDRLPDAFGLFEADETDETGTGNVFPLPGWKMTDMDGIEWQSDFFLQNYTIYIVGDISTRHGLDDILAWNYVLRQLITNPQAAWPPNIVTVASVMEGYYRYTEADIRRILKEEHSDEFTLGVQIADPEGKFPLSMGYTKLPQPIVIFVDDNGYIRLIMIGRIRDISSANIQSTMSVISEMWQWDEDESKILPTAITLLINLLRDTAYDETMRKQPPEQTAYQIAPTWGYPANYEELITRPTAAADPGSEHAPF